MRIKKLIIENFKNLKDFSIEFGDPMLNLIIGQNGTGKSNLLEAIITIFRDLDLGHNPNFKYQIDYTCRDYLIHIDADPTRQKKLDIMINDVRVSSKQFNQDCKEKYLPKYIFGYYSGFNKRMEALFERHMENFYNNSVYGTRKTPMRPLFYARHEVHSNFVLLAFFYEHDPTVMDFLYKYLHIDGLDSVLFIMKEPPWKSKKGDPRFWNAEGNVRVFLDKLYDLSLAPMRIQQEIHLDFRRRTKLEHLYLYLKDENTVRRLAIEYLGENKPSPQDFFKALEGAYISNIISDIRIRVKVKDIDGLLTFRELSEGEQQLILVLGLLRFTNEDESLILLDEPDTHLNPTWSQRYQDFLKQVIGDQKSSQIIMASHDPLIIANLESSQVRILTEENGLIFAECPEYEPIKMGYPEILISNMFKLASVTPPTMQELLEEKRKIEIKKEKNENDLDRLERLDDMLKEFDFTTVVKDPLYIEFVRAMSRLAEEDLVKTTSTKEQKDRRKQIAIDILRKLKDEEEKGLETYRP